MNKCKRPMLGNVLALLNIITVVYFLCLTIVSVVYKRAGQNIDLNNELVYSFLAFGMEPPLFVVALLLSIAITCFLFALKRGSLGTVGVGLSIIPDLFVVAACILTIAGVLPWEYVRKPDSIVAPLSVFSALFFMKFVFMFKLVGSDYYPKAKPN